MARRLGNISRETIPLLILFVAQQKPSRGGLWHPILMQFYSGPLMQLLSGVDTAHIIMDADEQLGQPIVSNGLPLTKLHHAAFDTHLADHPRHTLGIAAGGFPIARNP